MRAARCKKATILLNAAMLALCLILPSGTQAERLPIKTYTTTDGLARDQVNRIVQDSRGFLWFCTAEGLSRFDGYKFTNYGTDQGLPSRVVIDFLETRDGVYWVATARGLCRLNPTGERLPIADRGSRTESEILNPSEPMFVVYRPSEDAKTQYIAVLIEDRRGAIWCGTNGGLYRLDQAGGQWTFHVVDIGMPTEAGGNAVLAIQEDRRGALWVGTHGGGLYRRWPDGRTERYTTLHGLPNSPIGPLLEDRDGRLWIGTRKGLCQIVPEPDPNRLVVARVYTTKDGLPNNVIAQLFQTSDGRLWVGADPGLSEFIPTASKDDQKFRSYTRAQGLSDRAIEALAEDRDGNLWIGTESGGAMRLARNGFTAYSEADGLINPRIASIFENQAGELCVFSDGIIIHQFNGRRFIAIRPNLPRHITNLTGGWYQITFQSSTGEWWVPTGKGLCRFPKVSTVEQLAHTRPKAVYTTRDGLTGDGIFRLYEDSRGDIWISTMDDFKAVLTRWERATETFHRYSPADGIPEAAPTAFSEDRSGNLWIGFYDGGLARSRNGRFTLVTAADGLPAGQIRGLYLDAAGRLWIAASRGGLGRLDDPTADHLRFVTYTTAEGLASNEVRCVTEDQWGRIYIGTGRGLDRLDPTTGRVRHYTTADGVANNELNVAFRDRHGGLWFGTLQGLSRLVPEAEQPQTPPPILISGLRIAGVQQQISELGEAEVSGIGLGANQNDLQISFFSLSFALGEVLRYQYKLEGGDSNWSAPTDERSINYANLSPGSYRFLVRAVTADGTSSQPPASVTFRILPPTWQRWWFVSSAVLLIGLAIYAIDRYRIARLIELERVRTRIATDLHDDIGSSLSQIAILSEVARRHLSHADVPAMTPLARIAHLSRESVDAMSDIVWAVNPHKDRLSDLTHRMRHFANEVLLASDIEVRFQSSAADQDKRINADIRRQVFLIFKEGINNIVRHSACTEADIEFRNERAWLVLTLRDNGRGFDPERPQDGHGLTSLRRRAAALGGELEVISGPGRGTTVTLRIPQSN